MSFWTSEDKIPVRQTRVSIPCENGLNFTAGQTMNFMIPPTIEFIQPKETYLRWDVKIDMGTMIPTRLQLDKMGGSVCIRDIRIYSGGAGGTLLEEIQGYNCLTSLRYSYEQNESIRNKRSMTEGGQQYNPKSRGTLGGPQCETNNVTENANFNSFTNEVHPTVVTTAHAQQKVKCLLPIHTGIFQNDKVFPCLLTDGLRVEILLENAPRCIVPVSTTQESQPLVNKVVFHSVNGIDNNQDAGPQAWDSAGVTREVFVRRDNQQIELENFPFVVGEQVQFVDVSQNQTFLTATGTNAGSPLCAADIYPTIESIEHYAYSGDAAVPGGYWGLTKVRFTADVTRSLAAVNNRVMGGNTEAQACWGLVSRSFNVATQTQKDSIGYTLSDVELLIQQVEMPKGYTSKLMKMMKEGGSLNYDFLSYRNYRYSALAGDTQVNMRLPLVETRAKSILCIPTCSDVLNTAAQITGAPHDVNTPAAQEWPAWTTAESNKYGYDYNCTKVYNRNSDAGGVDANRYVPWFSDRTGLEGVWDFLTSYQLFYDGKLNPSRKVDTAGVSTGRSLSQQWAIEVEKSLAMGNIRPLSFRDLHKNCVIGRALSLQDGVYDTRGKDFNLQLSYEGTAADGVNNRAPTKNKLWNNYVCHLRRLVVKGNQISLEV